MQETQVLSLGQEDTLEEKSDMTEHLSTAAAGHHLQRRPPSSLYQEGQKLITRGNPRPSSAQRWPLTILSPDLPVCMLSHFSCVRLFATLWTVTHQAPLPKDSSRQEDWGEFHSVLLWIFLTGMEPISRIVGRFFTILSHQVKVNINTEDTFSF